jgi:hypothetical protein
VIRQCHRLAAFTFILLCFCCRTPAETVVCRLPGINGREANAARAHRFLPANTSDISKAVIYVENTPDGLYFHSNYVTPGAKNPTKILTTDSSEFRRIFVSIVYGSKSTYEEQETALAEFKRHVHILLDRSMFTEGGYPLVDVGDARYVAVVDGASGKFDIGPVDRLDRTSPPPILMSRVLGCCLFGIPPHLAGQYQKALEARPFDRKDVRLLSLVRDSGTKSAINESVSLKAANLGDSKGPITNLAQIESVLRAASGTTVVLVSHVEGTNFVIRDAAQKLVSSMPIDSVRALASKYNVELIDLGCETAQQLTLKNLGIGVTTKFNTVDAVRALDRALAKSANYGDFFQAITSENLRVVVDQGFMRGWPLCADVYAKAQNRPIWVKLARIFVSFRQSHVSTYWIPNDAAPIEIRADI